VRELRTAFVDLLLPPHCPACGLEGRPDGRLCRPCAAHLVNRPADGCGRCGEPIVPGGACVADHRWLEGIAWARAPFAYAGTGGALVRRLKLSGDFAALPLLAGAIVDAAATLTTGAWHRAVLVPVPLHPQRRRRRGFDQARLLATAVAERTGAPVASCLRRNVATLPQGDPRVTSRERNVEGAFAVARAQAVRGRHAVLIDDVTTSGATVRACARLLRAAGAERVAVLAACRA
jgi:ComF family protein